MSNTIHIVKKRVSGLLHRDSLDQFAGSKFMGDIVQGKTCVPITLHEFRLFLKYQEHSLENLDFYLWFQDYKRRWDQLPLDAKLLSPPPQEKPSYVGYVLSSTVKQYNTDNIESGDSGLIGAHGEAGDTVEESGVRHSNTSVGATDLNHYDASSTLTSSTYTGQYHDIKNVPSHNSYYQGTDPKLQPFRAEVEKVLKTFFSETSEKELNIDGYLRQYVLHNIKYTTHPEVFEPVRDKVYETIERSSLRNFMNHALQNIDRHGVIVRYTLSFLCLILVACVIIFTFVFHASRWYRIFMLPAATGSIAIFVFAQRGLCFNRAMMSRRMLSSYELIGAEEEQEDTYGPQKFEFYETETAPEDLHIVQDPLVKRYHFSILLVPVILASLSPTRSYHFHSEVATPLANNMSNYWDQRRSIFCFKIPNPFRLLGEKQRAVGVYAAGAFFAIGWWAFIDAITLASKDPFKQVNIGFEDWISGILTTLGMLVINLIDKSSLHGETFSYSGDSLVWKARLFLFVGFALIAGGLAGSVPNDKDEL
ncbi:hypothetical protein NQZ79_g2353 [Umbelopsis isabellina]|nr:hypothetical protein NQZ79_g2353 [Umbelopsis isabellina]